MRITPAEEYAIAQEEERAAWVAVKDKLPSTPTYSPELWDAWREAVKKTDQARRRFIATILPGHQP